MRSSIFLLFSQKGRREARRGQKKGLKFFQEQRKEGQKEANTSKWGRNIHISMKKRTLLGANDSAIQGTSSSSPLYSLLPSPNDQHLTTESSNGSITQGIRASSFVGSPGATSSCLFLVVRPGATSSVLVSSSSSSSSSRSSSSSSKARSPY